MVISHYNTYVERQPNCTYMVRLTFLCANEASEFFMFNTEQEEASIEDLAAQYLLTLFDEVRIDEVRFLQTETTYEQAPMYMLSINAICPHHIFPASSQKIAMLEYAIESTVGSILTELFSTVYVEEVEVQFVPIRGEYCA
jgi:hypothetical protein